MRKLLWTKTVVSAFLLGVGLNTVRAAVFSENYPGAPFTYVNAFNANDSSRGVNHTGDSFTDGVDATPFTVSLLPLHPQYLTTPNNDVNFSSVLSLAYPNWTFTYNNALTGNPSISAKTYSTYTTNISGSVYVGTELYLSYSAGTMDPSGSGVHWIQVVSNNWSIAVNYSGVVSNFVDVKPSSASRPFYDNGTLAYDATSTNFDDTPQRDVESLTNYNGTPLTWLGEAFLVQDTGANGSGGDNVKVFGGVEWGFQVVPEPSTVMLVGISSVALLAIRRRKRR